MLDCDGVDATEEYTIRTKVKIAGSRIEVDLSGSSRQARTCINCGWLDVKTSVADLPEVPARAARAVHLGRLPPRRHRPAGGLGRLGAAAGRGDHALLGRGARRVFIGDPAGARRRASGRGRSPATSARRWSTTPTACARTERRGRRRRYAVARSARGARRATATARTRSAIYLANSIAPPIESTERDAPLVLLRREVDDRLRWRRAQPRRRGDDQGHAVAPRSRDQYCVRAARQEGSAAPVSTAARDGKPGGIWMWHGDRTREPDFVGSDAESMLRADPICGVIDPSHAPARSRASGPTSTSAASRSGGRRRTRSRAIRRTPAGAGVTR